MLKRATAIGLFAALDIVLAGALILGLGSGCGAFIGLGAEIVVTAVFFGIPAAMLLVVATIVGACFVRFSVRPWMVVACVLAVGLVVDTLVPHGRAPGSGGCEFDF